MDSSLRRPDVCQKVLGRRFAFGDSGAQARRSGSEEARVRERERRAGVAKADYFPQIPLTANVGSQRRALTNFLKGPPAFWAIGAQLAQSIYVGGKITSKPYSKHS